eukprot:Gb_26403 [translate_table: standard]
MRSCSRGGECTESGVSHECISTLRGHDGRCVYSLALAGKLLYSGSIGKDIRLWQHVGISNGLEYCRFGYEGGAVKSLVVAQDKIFSAHQDHKIRVWRRSEVNPTKHKLVSTVPILKDYLLNLIVPNNYVQVRRHKKCLWIEHVDTVSALAVDHNKGILYSASWDRTVKAWRLSDFRCLESFRAHDDAINALAVSAEGLVYTASADSKVKVWKTKHIIGHGQKQPSLIKVLDGHKSAVNALALASDDSILYSAGADSSIIVWRLDKLGDRRDEISAVEELKGHRQAVLCLAVVWNAVCSGSADNSIRVWRREAFNLHCCVAVLEGHNGPVKCITACIDEPSMNCVIYSGSVDGDIRIWCVFFSRQRLG